MKSTRLLVSKLWGCLLVIPLAQAGTVGSPTQNHPSQSELTLDEAGTWAAHDIVARFNYLPKSYSCDELEERFHDLLLALGARPDMTVRAYDCGSESYSPRVHLQFSTPGSLLKTQTPTVEGSARPRTVRLGPGTPRSWTREDCELMRQVKDQLLTKVSPRVVSFSLACSAPPLNSEHYNVTVQTPESVGTAARVASVAETDPKSLPR